MCPWGLWEKEAVLYSITYKLFKTKRELAMGQEVAEVSPGLARCRARAPGAGWETGVLEK